MLSLPSYFLKFMAFQTESVHLFFLFYFLLQQLTGYWWRQKHLLFNWYLSALHFYYCTMQHSFPTLQCVNLSMYCGMKETVAEWSVLLYIRKTITRTSKIKGFYRTYFRSDAEHNGRYKSHIFYVFISRNVICWLYYMSVQLPDRNI